MAEQAINTVYALAERPDLICDRLIKNLTRRAFEKKPAEPQSIPGQDPSTMDEDLAVNENPDESMAAEQGTAEGEKEDKDTGDAFVLSQLVFVVGHVAIKQIVFLELVEREWKRQKHEREVGELTFRCP